MKRECFFTTNSPIFRVLREMYSENRLSLIICYITGCRISRVLRVQRSDLSGDYISIDHVRYRLPPQVAAALKRIAPRAGYIFPHRDFPDRHRTRQAVYKDLLRAQRDIGVYEGFTPLGVSKMLLSSKQMPL